MAGRVGEGFWDRVYVGFADWQLSLVRYVKV